MDALPQIPQSWFQYVVGALAAFVLWVIRGIFADVKIVKENYMTRAEFEKAMASSRAEFTAAITAHNTASTQRMDTMHNDNSGNFRELRGRLDLMNTAIFELAKGSK